MVQAVLDAASEFRGILEIGPGPGILTSPLSLRAKVISLELDDRLAAFAAEMAPDAHVIRCDALAADWGPLLSSLPEPRGIVSNMPYQITGPLLGRTADCVPLIQGAVLMMQKEVGQRVLAQAGDSDRGYISVWLQSLFDIRRAASAPAGAFSPPPKVDSVVLSLSRKEGFPASAVLAIAREGFVQPRKTLANNLRAHPGIAEALISAGLSPSARAHQLTWSQWQKLVEALS